MLGTYDQTSSSWLAALPWAVSVLLTSTYREQSFRYRLPIGVTSSRIGTWREGRGFVLVVIQAGPSKAGRNRYLEGRVTWTRQRVLGHVQWESLQAVRRCRSRAAAPLYARCSARYRCEWRCIAVADPPRHTGVRSRGLSTPGGQNVILVLVELVGRAGKADLQIRGRCLVTL